MFDVCRGPEVLRRRKQVLAKILIRYGSVDERFADRLMTDLASYGMEVTLSEWPSGFSWGSPAPPDTAQFDFCCVIVNAANSPAAGAEVERLMKIEGASGLILPLLLAGATLPEQAKNIKYADFSTDYGFGVRQLLSTFGRVAVQKVADLQGYTVISGRRGAANLVRSFSSADGITEAAAFSSLRMTTQVLGNKNAALISLISLSGEPTFVHISRQVAEGMLMYQLRVQDISGSELDFKQFFLVVDNIIKETNQKEQLKGCRRIAGKLGLIILRENIADVCAIGATGVIWCKRSRGEVRLKRCDTVREYHVDLTLGKDDDQARFADAPLGFLGDEAALHVEPVRIALSNTGDYVALTSFVLPLFQELNEFLLRLSRYDDSAHVVRAIARSYWPYDADCLACCLQRT
jgi:hypothetical protein